MSDTIERQRGERQPGTSPQPSPSSVQDGWVFKALGMRVERSLNRPRKMPDLPPLPDLAPRANAAMNAARPLLIAASRTRAVSPDMVAAKKLLTDQYSALVADLKAGNYQAVIRAVPAAEAAARKVLAMAEAAQAQARQLETQQTQYDDMKGLFDEVVRISFNPNAAASAGRILKEKLNPGKRFTRYLTALEAVEQSRAALPKGNPALPPDMVATVKADCAALIAVAQDYLSHFDTDLSDREKRDKTNLRKFQIVTEGLKSARHMALAMDMQSVGAPTEDQPWDRETELRVGGLRAAISFESGYKKGGDLKTGGGGGMSEAFWVESAPPGQQKPTKNFLFKPTRGEVSPAPDDAPGAGAAKEALASANAKLFARQTGIDMGVPDTHVTTIGSYALDLGDNDDGASRTGSLQEFAPSDGPLSDVSMDTRRKIPPGQCRKIALHDIMSLNFDRHGGNMLMKTPPDGGPPELIPIDHGCTLPTRKDFAGLAQRVGGMTRTATGTVTVQNAMLGLPGAYEPFDPDTLAKLDLLDPEAMVQGMRAQLGALDKVNPGLDSQTKVPEESLQMSKRSMMFMKAAAPVLSPAEIQIAIGQHGEELFDADDAHFDGVAARIIAEMQPKKAAYFEIFTSGGVQLKKICDTLQENGWMPGHGDMAGWVMADPQAALALYKSGEVNDIAQPEPNGRRKATAQQVQDKLARLDPDTVLRRSITMLTAQADDDLQDVDQTAAATLAPLRQEIAQLLTNGDAAGAEAKAQELERQALMLGLAAARAEGDALYLRRDIVFAGMGSQDEENEKRRRAKTRQAGDVIFARLNQRNIVDTAYDSLKKATTSLADLPEARIQLAKLRQRLTPQQ